MPKIPALVPKLQRLQNKWSDSKGDNDSPISGRFFILIIVQRKSAQAQI